MKITIEGEGRSVAVEEGEAVDVHAVMELIEKALLGFGFQPESVKVGFEGMCDE